MIFLFLFSKVSSLEDVTERNILSRNKNFFGEWEYTGNSSIIDDKFLFLTEERTTAGIYFTHTLPKDEWSSKIKFSFPKNSTISQFGIWLTKDFAPEGYVFGGPPQFYGFAILVIKQNESIFIEIRENDSKGKYTSYSFTPQFKANLTDEENLGFSIEYNKKNATKIFLNNGGKDFELFNDRLRVDVKKYYFAITGISQKNKEKREMKGFFIDSIDFQTNSTENTLKEAILPEIEFVDKHANNEFINTNKKKTEIRETTCLDVISEIEKLQKYSNLLSSSSFVCREISIQMFSISDKWQRRSIKMQRRTFQLRENITKLMNKTSKSFTQISDTISDNLGDLMQNIHNETSKLYYSIFFETDIEDEAAKHDDTPEGKGLIKVLFLLSMVEVIIFIGVASAKLIRPCTV